MSSKVPSHPARGAVILISCCASLCSEPNRSSAVTLPSGGCFAASSSQLCPRLLMTPGRKGALISQALEGQSSVPAEWSDGSCSAIHPRRGDD